MTGSTRALPLLGLAALLFAAPAAGQDRTAVAAELRERIELLRSRGTLEVDGARIEATRVPPGVYEEGAFMPLWTTEALRRLIPALASLEGHGLTTAAYAVEQLRARVSTSTTSAAGAELDLLATAALVRAVEDLRGGRVRDATERAFPAPAPLEPGEIRAMILGGDPGRAVAAAAPDHPVYRGLVEVLAGLRRTAAAGGWAPIPDGPSMRLDSLDARVPPLRERLAAAGDPLPDEGSSSDLRFDARLETAVRSFQHRHGLNEDGIVGRATLRELNVPVEARIDQVRVNLERARWMAEAPPPQLVVVNVAGARAYLVRGGAAVFETRVVVGRTQTRTPVFHAELRYVDLNPTWTVPPGIVAEILAKARRDPGYLARERIRVLDGTGRSVSPSSIDFGRYTGRDFPWVFRQDPGPTNALGRVKLVFPNPHHVYLHDTPARHLFEREERTFSHGCIRVQDPLRLVELVLDDPAWTRASLERAIAAGNTRSIPLARPIPVFILYWTASVDLHAELHFYRDVYGRDPPLLRALDAR